MTFEWGRIHKWEENHERNISDDVEEYVCEHYGISSIEEMTEEQYREIEVFYEEMNEFSVMRIGFSNVLHDWLNYREEEGLDFDA